VHTNRKTVRRIASAAAVAALALLGLAVVAGCTSSSNSSESMRQAAGGAVAEGAPTSAGAPASAAAGSSAAEPGAPSGVSGGADDGSGYHSGSTGSDGNVVNSNAPIPDDRQIIRTAAVALQVTVAEGKTDAETQAALARAASDAATKVRALAPGTGGYVSASDGGGSTVSVTLRIPATSYDAVMNGLASIGQVTSRTEKTDDVTDEMVDVASRLATMQASVDRIRALLAKADKIGDVIAIESELTQREADLESLENRQAALKDQVALSTIVVTITAVTPTAIAAQPVSQRHGFLAGLAAGWHALASFGTWLASVLGALLPFLPFLAVIAAVAVWISRRRRRLVAPATPGAAVTVEETRSAE
jgi:hypothetical protein